MSKVKICDICGQINPEVKATAKQSVTTSIKYLWRTDDVKQRTYDICNTCWSKVLTSINPLNSKGRRYPKKIIKASHRRPSKADRRLEVKNE